MKEIFINELMSTAELSVYTECLSTVMLEENIALSLPNFFLETKHSDADVNHCSYFTLGVIPPKRSQNLPDRIVVNFVFESFRDFLSWIFVEVFVESCSNYLYRPTA